MGQVSHLSSEFAIETFSGRFVDTYHPQSNSIDVHDIAHALSLTCRYGGHCAKFYSVAEHAVFVSTRLERRNHNAIVCLAGLHHDGSEAYLVDIPRPMKPLLGYTYDILTERMDAAIVEGLALPFPASLFEYPAVKEADIWALFVEARYLLSSKGKDWELEIPSRIVTPDYWKGGESPADAEAAYLARHAELMERIKS